MYKYIPQYSSKFKKDQRKLDKRGYDISELKHTIHLLLLGSMLPPEYKDHALKGEYTGFRECHVGGAFDWLLIYKIIDDCLILVLTETGTHSDLFG